MSLMSDLRADLADWWRRFWNQPNKAWRNFHLVFFLIGVHFLVFSLSYITGWPGIVTTFDWAGHALGIDSHYVVVETSYIWRARSVANQLGMAFMCFILQANVRRFYPVLLPLCALKGLVAIAYLFIYTLRYHYSFFVLVSLWDALLVLLFLYFAHTARWSIEEWGEDVLVPRLFLKAH
jgi:hypothetical protein